jgi:ADP-dependent NAD(P)H-hydrate dehydratase / NAD(P)H-hydrate epimerase
MSAVEPLYTAEEMRAAEAAYEGPTLDLMERAGAATSELVLARFPDAKRFTVWCGTGANGGDGFVVARLLRKAGHEAEVVLTGPEEKIEGDAAETLARARKAGVPFVDAASTPDVAVDAIFGTGFSGVPRREAAAKIGEIRGHAVPVVSVDVPSGVNASTGVVPGAAVTADLTVTFHAHKLGLVIGPGRYRTGEIAVADIGLAETRTRNHRATKKILGEVPRRGPLDHKYSAGHVVVVGGSTGLTGAPSLTAEAAMRAGAGYVRAVVPESLAPVFAQRFVEVTLSPAPCDDEGRLTPDALEVILAATESADAVAIGPGLGRSDGTRELVQILLDRIERPVVLDGDGLWALTGHLEWVFTRDVPTVLTPHAGELGRLLGRESSWVDAHRLSAVGGAADDVGAVVMLKGADTLVAAPGRGVLVSDLGTPGLASAGTGDVLTGIVAAFLAKGMEAQRAAVAAAAAEGLAARDAAILHGEAGLIARDVIESLSPVLSRA